MVKTRGRRLKAAKAAGHDPSGRTHLLGVLAGGAVLTVFGAELTRVWRLGMLPVSREEAASDQKPSKVLHAVRVMREGYSVSRTRENSLFNMLASFTVAFGITRGITWTIRTKGGIGPIPPFSRIVHVIARVVPNATVNEASMLNSEFSRVRETA